MDSFAMSYATTSRPLAAPRLRRLTFKRVGPLARTIRGRILVAFLAMSIITAALGGYSALHIRETGSLASKTYDQSLMAVSYARAASADFAMMQNVLMRRRVASTASARVELDKQIDDLRASLTEDLTIAGSRSQSLRANQAAAKARLAVIDWNAARLTMPEQEASQEPWTSIDENVAAVNQQIDLLVNYTAGDGFLYRQNAKLITAADIRENLVGTCMAVLLSAFVVWLLARRIIRPVAAASTVARQIAMGELDCIIPEGNGDELGALLTAMGIMRHNLREMMEREVAQRRSAQTRLADALESSREGIVVVDRGGMIALANSQVAALLAVSPHLLQPGAKATALAAALAIPTLFGGQAAAKDKGHLTTNDVRLCDGRWLRISESATHEGGFLVVLSDLTMLKQHEERLRASNLSLDAALENMSQGLCLYDANSRLIIVNKRYSEIFRLDPRNVHPGLTFDQMFQLKIAAGNYNDRTAAEVIAARASHLAGRSGETVFEETTNERTIAITHRPTEDGGWVVTYEDVTERRQAERQILFLARHDSLTLLPNRTLFAERIEQALAQLGRGKSFAVLCLDLDRFKQVNDTMGHPVGDCLLRHVADRLRSCVRETDTVTRLGGDEFAVIQADIDGLDTVITLAKLIIDALHAPLVIEGQPVSIGVSVGISIAPTDGSSATELMKNADAALYRAKADGKGIWRCFEPTMDTQLHERRTLEADLWKGLAEEQFEVNYQPLYDLDENRIGGFEALLRWNHPTRGRVAPADFIAIAEEIGVIVPLGEWVLRRACAEACRWPETVKVAVNVSPAQFNKAELVATVLDALATSGLSPGRLELEITETVLLANSSAVLETLHTLRKRGVRFAMDDFGTGYSSLSYLRSFPFDKLKIDQSFIRDLTTTSESGVIVRAMTGLGGSLGMRTTAEGVESADQLARVRADGCNEVQGYYISPPVAASAIDALLERWDSTSNAVAA